MKTQINIKLTLSEKIRILFGGKILIPPIAHEEKVYEIHIN